MKHQTITYFSLLFVLFMFGISQRPSYAADEKLTNASVIELQSLNLGDGVIIEKIKTSPCDFDTSIAGLKLLKDAKISPAVIQAMIATKAAVAPTPAAISAVSGDPNDPAVAHAAGTWVLMETNGVQKMIQLQSELPAGQTTGGGGAWAMGWGASVKTQVILSGSKSDLLLNSSKPVFYLYLGQAAGVNPADAAMEFASVQNPKEIILAKFTRKTDKNHDERLLTTATHNAYAGSNFGVEPAAMRAFDTEKIGDGIYKVVLKGDLNDGEYAFCSALSQGHGRFFTFGILLPPAP